MEPTDKPSLIASLLDKIRKKVDPPDEPVAGFLPDADEIERSPLPKGAQLTLHALAGMLVCFVLWAMISEVDMVVMARGRLITPLPNIVVQPLETAIVQNINVRVGQIVKKGDRLATLDPTFTEADEAQLRTRLRSLDNQAQRLEAELSGKKTEAPSTSDQDGQLQTRLASERQATYNAQLLRTEETVSRLRAAVETNRRDQSALVSRVKVLKEAAEMQEKLVAQKYAVRLRLLDAQDRLLEAERSLEMARSRENELRRELAGAEAEKTAFSTGWRQKIMEELLTVSRDRDGVNEQLQKADRRNKLVVLTSPSDAVVLEIAKLSQGSVVTAAERFVTLVPIGTELEAEIEIDSLDVGYVKVGSEAHVKLDAFPFQKHGTLPGELRTISEDAFRRENSQSGGAYYMSRIHMKSMQLSAMPEKVRLLPGMTLSAEIVVGKRSVMSYMLWPLIKALGESIREP